MSRVTDAFLDAATFVPRVIRLDGARYGTATLLTAAGAGLGVVMRRPVTRGRLR
ncbi:hypothetical protein [Streptomyces sp. NPDC048172]|uniref:hypothetical protein n=1 Tax=Streptomyces sp. NPDC048172 TaxID=3365505 RepID=UPI0037248B5A